MMTKMRAILSLMVFSAFFLSVALPGNAANMKLLTPEVGWVLHSPGLMWTTDGGAHWKNITPPPASAPAGALIAKEHIASVFFLDTLNGWALLSGPEKGSEEPHFDLAATNDAGATWSITGVTIPDLNPRSYLLGGGGYMYFVDYMHGWINLSLVSSAAVRGALLIETQDGGRTWKWVASPGRGGPIYFTDTNDGWLAGGPDGKLYVTHDGTNTWQEVSLQPPPSAGRAIYPTYGLPVFQNGEQGVLPVTFSGTEGVNSVVVLFTSSDGGRTWEPDSAVPTLKQTSVGQGLPASVADSTLITGSVSDHSLTLTKATRGGKISANANIAPPRSAIVALSFVDRMDGWAMVEYNGTSTSLLSTPDGGNTWTDITPRPPRKPFPPATPRKWGPIDPITGKPFRPAKPQAAASAVAPIAGSPSIDPGLSLSVTPEAPGGAFHTSVHLGFEQCQADTSDHMANWWTDSPYYDTGIYIGGANRACSQPYLTSTWVTQVESQGWGLMPLWVGLQAPCTDNTQVSTFSDSPSVAATQGEAEADSAASAASNLGLSKAVIYYDLENYDTTNDPQCGPAVTSFVGGWASELHNKGYSAAVYTNPDPAEAQVSQASPLPDEVWIAKWDGRATIWGLNPLDDNLWQTGQRIHQYVQNVSEKWGNVTFTIDSDIEDAPVAGSNGAKTYTFTVNDFVNTQYSPTSVSDVVSSGSQLTYKYNQGQIVGYYYLGAGYGFLYDPTTGFSQIAYNGATETDARGLNNQDQIVGGYRYNTGVGLQGFLYQNGGFSTIDVAGALETDLRGINDDGQMVGYYADANWNDHGLFLSAVGSTPQTINYPNATDTVAWSINGAGQIVGSYIDARGKNHGFLYDNGSFTSIDCKGATNTDVYRINNNQQIVGTCDYAGFLYDYVHGTFTPINYPAEPQTWLRGINDGDQMTGYWIDPQNDIWGGFTVTH